MTTESTSGSRRRPLRFWGWGYADESLTADETALTEGLAAMLSGNGIARTPPPRLEDFNLPPPRLAPPGVLSAHVSTSAYDRLVHTFGKSYADMARMCLRQVDVAPDAVAFPRTEQEIGDLLDWAGDQAVAVIPFGGGTSVCGGVEADVGEDYRATLSLDLQYLDRVLEIDRTSRAARIQAGAFGPAIEAALRPHALTLRHFPQSFEFSTLGGWIATRSGGHFASLYTHIDDFVQSTRTITPRGVIETLRVPGSGAGPSPDRLLIGSEGTLGLITEAWMRLQDRPLHRASTVATFERFGDAVNAVRALAQSGLYPTNCRLLDPAEAGLNQVGNGRDAVLVLGFESADHPVNGWLERALELVRDHGGRHDLPGHDRAEKAGPDAAADWRHRFLRMPYLRNDLTLMGVIADTFETAVTWDRFQALYDGVREAVGKVIADVTGRPPMISCRFTHVYPDGVAPYFSFFALGTPDGKLAEALARWRDIKCAANDAVTALGGTITHHHGVGRDHRSGYERQSPALFREALAAAKQALDPAAILNPGVLIDPASKNPGGTGATVVR